MIIFGATTTSQRPRICEVEEARVYEASLPEYMTMRSASKSVKWTSDFARLASKSVTLASVQGQNYVSYSSDFSVGGVEH